jgi:hypothetical protein
MAASTPERIPGQLVLLRGLLAGGALGAVCIASAGLVLFDAEGLLTGATGLTATILAALLTGLWAGAPGDDDALPFTERWIASGIATAVAGGFATFLTLYGAVGPGPLTRAISLIALVAAPVYAIGMLLPVLLAWGEQLQQEVADAQGEDPEEGVVGRLVVGVLGGAAVGILVAGVVLVSWLGAGPLLLAVAVMLFAPVVLPEPEIAVANERLLAESHTPFSHIRVTEVVFPGERQPERRLYIGEEQESGELVRSGAPTLAYIVAGESWLTGSTRAGASYLFLGGGAYTLPRRISERDPSASITVVELDPEITRAANRFFGLRRDHSIRSVHGDARAFLEADHRSWDRIYLDVYSGSEALPVPDGYPRGVRSCARSAQPGRAARGEPDRCGRRRRGGEGVVRGAHPGRRLPRRRRVLALRRRLPRPAESPRDRGSSREHLVSRARRALRTVAAERMACCGNHGVP